MARREDERPAADEKGEDVRPIPSRDVATQYVVLPCYEKDGADADSIVAPPSQVLKVEVIGSTAYLSICKLEYNQDTRTEMPLPVEDCDVDAKALLQALISQMDYEVVRLVMPLVWTEPPR